jgi:hypothetical protein
LREGEREGRKERGRGRERKKGEERRGKERRGKERRGEEALLAYWLAPLPATLIIVL